MVRAVLVVLSCVLWACGSSGDALVPDQAELDRLAEAMTFYASFEDGMDAAQARDDRRIYSAPSYDELDDRGPWYWGQNVSTAYDSGAAGHALEFNGELTQALFYSAEGNLPWSEGGAISFWMRPSGSSGVPLAVAAMDAVESAVSVELDGAALKLIAWGQMVEASLTDSAEGEWVHVAASFNADGVATLFVDGEQRGSTKAADARPNPSTVRLGVDYAGLLDELSAFSRPLEAEEVRYLQLQPGLPASLMR